MDGLIVLCHGICKPVVISNLKYTKLYFNLLQYREALQFSFGPLIQKELDCLVMEWNNHRIRRYNLSEVPSGVPEVLYHLPETVG